MTDVAPRDGRQTHYSAQPKALTPLIDWLGLYAANYGWQRFVGELERVAAKLD